MRNFQDIFETCKRSFISAFAIFMTVPLSKKKLLRFSSLELPLVKVSQKAF